MRKRLWAAILSLVMIISLLPTTALAAEPEVAETTAAKEIALYKSYNVHVRYVFKDESKKTKADDTKSSGPITNAITPFSVAETGYNCTATPTSGSAECEIDIAGLLHVRKVNQDSVITVTYTPKDNYIYIDKYYDKGNLLWDKWTGENIQLNGYKFVDNNALEEKSVIADSDLTPEMENYRFLTVNGVTYDFSFASLAPVKGETPTPITDVWYDRDEGTWYYSHTDRKGLLGLGDKIPVVNRGGINFCYNTVHSESSEYHDFEVVKKTVAPTCTEQGYTVYKCAYCTETETRDYTDSLGHDWKWVHVGGTEKENSQHQQVCQREGCNATSTPVSCDFVDTSIGTGTRHTCKDCGYYYDESTPQTETVYVYFKTVYSENGTEKDVPVEGVSYNKNTSAKWATLGKLTTTKDVAKALPADIGAEVNKTNSKFVKHQDNENFDLNLINEWVDLKQDNGAAGYKEEAPFGTDVWHLDGKVTAYRVVYCDSNGTELTNFAPNTAPTYYLKNAANVSLTGEKPVSSDLSKQFLGWSTAPEAAAPDDGITVSFANGDMKVYAVWGSKTPATLTVTKVVETSDGTTIPESDLPRQFEFYFDSEDVYAKKYYYDLNTSQSNGEWTWGPATSVDGYYFNNSNQKAQLSMPLCVGQKWLFSEPYFNIQGSEINWIDGYDLIETKYYVNGTEMVPDTKDGIDIELQEETNIRVVNTYRKITEDIYANGALSFQHQVEGFTAWDDSDTKAHKATKQDPTIDYQVELDLSKLTLSEGGKDKTHAGTNNFLEEVKKYLALKENQFKTLYGDLTLNLVFDEKEVKKLTDQEADNLGNSINGVGFHATSVELTSPENGKWGLEIKLYLYLSQPYWTDKITISGLQLQLAKALTDQDTDKNPRTITAEASLTGGNIRIESMIALASAAVSVQAEPELVPANFNQPLTLSDMTATNTAKLYWKETGKDDKDDDKDPKYTLTLTKVDAETGSPLPGAKFELYQVGKKSDTLIGQSRYQTTDKNGKLSVSVSDSGEYYWVEIQPPQGYTIDKSEHYTDTGRNSSITVTNQKTGTPSQLTDDHFAYVIGYQDGTVRPYGLISRAETTTIFFRLLKDEVRDSNLRTSNTFKDVSDDYWANTAISTMTGLGIVTGRSADTFDPRAPITRAQFAAICARFDTGVRTGSTKFTDTEGHWAQAYIERAAELGWVQGFEDGSFRPDTYITRAQAMTMINRVLSRLPYDADDLSDGMNEWPDCTPNDWFYLAVQEATNSHNYTYTKHSNAGVYETWTKLKADPDWTRYEH